MRRLLAVLLIIAIWGCSKEEEKTQRDEYVSPAVMRAQEAIVSVFASDGDLLSVDAHELKVADFQRLLEGVSPEATLWMPGVETWLIVNPRKGTRTELSEAMAAFSLLDSPGSFSGMFASYAGTIAEMLPAFKDLDANAFVAPENFTTRDIPDIRWLNTRGVDQDILKMTADDIRSMQVVRRLVLEGSMKAALAKDKKGEEAAVDCWTRAAKRNPEDPMLLERIDRLNRNAKGFLEVGKVLQAMKCYETLVLIRPTDAAAVHNFGMCLKKIGKLDLAKKVLKRAEALAK